MNIGERLAKIAELVPQNAKFADIGTDHAYLPVALVIDKKIDKAIAGDIAAGPCQAARNTVSMYGCTKNIQVRQGSGLEILKAGEADVIAIAGMGAGTIIEILSASPEIAQEAQLILQPMTGAESLREWLSLQSWKITDETLVLENNHLYDIICAKYVGRPQPVASKAERYIGTINMAKKEPILRAQFDKHLAAVRKLLGNMSHSEKAMETDKYKELNKLLKELEVLADAYSGK